MLYVEIISSDMEQDSLFKRHGDSGNNSLCLNPSMPKFYGSSIITFRSLHSHYNSLFLV
jgi:hypothetical protein